MRSQQNTHSAEKIRALHASLIINTNMLKLCRGARSDDTYKSNLRRIHM
jgi:hypothetical protein